MQKKTQRKRRDLKKRTRIQRRLQRGGGKFDAEIANAREIKVLSLPGKSITDADIPEIVTALKTILDLKKLYLYTNDIGVEGARRLATVLWKLTSLDTLALSANNLGDEGARHIATALVHMTKLEHLSFSNNGIGDVGAREIAKALPRLTILSSLDLSSNILTGIGATALAETIPPSLYELKLTYNHLIKEEDKSKIANKDRRVNFFPF